MPYLYKLWVTEFAGIVISGSHRRFPRVKVLPVLRIGKVTAGGQMQLAVVLIADITARIIGNRRLRCCGVWRGGYIRAVR